MRSALRDLEAITAKIAKDDPDAAERFGNDLIDQALALGQFPQMGRVVPEFKDPTIREISQTPYRIIYRLRPTTERLHILRFWHAARGTPYI